MLSNPTAGRRLTGRVIVFTAIAVALPLTATRAIHYIDVPADREARPVAAPATAALAVQASPAAPAQPAAPTKPLIIHDDGKLMINGQEKEWKDLTPAEKAEVRRSLAEARESLSRVNSDEIQREVREAMEEARIDQAELRRDMAEARAEIDQAMREIDSHSAEVRRSGQDPEQIKATVRASLKAVQAIDVEAITRQAMASVDPATINAALAAAEAGLEKAEAEIERIEESYERDD